MRPSDLLPPLRLPRMPDTLPPKAFGTVAGCTPIVRPRPGGPALISIVYGPSVQHLSISGRNRARFACTRRNTSAYGLLLDNFTHTFRTVTRTNAPIFN